jgi:hypothetical protein
VRAALGRNVSGVFVPIKPTLVTVLISSAAHEDASAVPVGWSAKAAAMTANLRPTCTSDRPELPGTLVSCSVDVEIRPEPTEDERAAIAAALAEEAERPAPAPWNEDEAEPIP